MRPVVDREFVFADMLASFECFKAGRGTRGSGRYA
jgi:hypothetical protein